MAALLCARLVCYVRKELPLNVEACHCWSDSLVALGCIRGETCRWKPFMANRVREIQCLLSPQYWGHCPTQDNPADLASRGCSITTLAASATWWLGPPWLREAPSAWSMRGDLSTPGDVEEVERE
ncbi:hypothetical protein T4C_2153 [Trichinella pseudospiralis]|uniref:Uncharacterized protein n=5 Tax=Trichinella pseudospiralis TaxID=6337 RepID=A0A0V1IHH5_TRIPS|nr:hypothetical protein T4C_13054 [Trichinella pseudospiralis]KRZ22039.1 hypothetical protein T4C_13248 [Trichinella pseudospiralis]KRZ22066.1 hypothetical protein T4C_2153 [Trichinella pseudospiralis]